MDKNSKIYVAGHQGLVGSAIARVLLEKGYKNIIGMPHNKLDLTNQYATEQFFKENKPEYVFLAAAMVGGIYANSTYPANFIYSNLSVQTNIINSSWKYGVKKLLFLGSSCIYPKFCPQPMKEEHLLSGYLESTNEAYAIAKIAGIIMCKSYNNQYGTDYISVMPTNLYGPRDNYHPMNSHVLPALIRRFHEAKVNKNKEVIIWGTGNPTREFLYSEDLAAACIFLMETYSGNDIVNIGSGHEVTIRDLAYYIKDAVKYEGNIAFDLSKPDGTPRKLIDSSKIHQMGWRHTIGLDVGLKLTYSNFLMMQKDPHMSHRF